MSNKKCLTCKNEDYCRGLCQNCYGSAMYALSTGKFTEADAIAKGLILPAREKISAWLKQAEKAIK